jgi:hypothetical protein
LGTYALANEANCYFFRKAQQQPNVEIHFTNPEGKQTYRGVVGYAHRMLFGSSWSAPTSRTRQGQMRHSRASTTLDIYQQFVPESQQRVVAKLSNLSRMVN